MTRLFLKKAKEITNQVLGRTVAWDIEPQILDQNPSGEAVPESRTFAGMLNDKFYLNAEPNFRIRGDTDDSSISMVPYFPGSTELLIYNFFGQNYAIRDPILFRVVLVHKDKPVASRQFLLESNGVKWISDVDDFLQTDVTKMVPGVLLVSAHHPRISTRQREFRFFGFCRSSQGMAGCHSMPAGFASLPRGQVSHRAIASEKDLNNQKAFVAALGAGTIPLRAVETIPSYHTRADTQLATATHTQPYYSVPAYIVATNEENQCVGFWHDGPATHAVNSDKRQKGTARTAIGLPQFNRFAPKILISENQVGQPVEEVTITLFTPGGDLITKRKLTDLPVPDCVLDMAEIFEDEKHNLVDVTAQFDFGFDSSPNPKPVELFLHVYFQENGHVLDQTHTLRTIGRAAEPVPAPRGYRARKFAPVFVGGDRRSAFCINNVSPYGHLPETEFLLRFFLDNGREEVHKVAVPSNRSALFWADDFISGETDMRAGVVWIEHSSVNASAHWYVFDKQGGPAADHFTGG